MNDVKSYSIKGVNSILDNVHGLITLTEVENAIERLPVFKRLQDISQLGLVKRIFPCAVHSRYTHSLGVMYVADKMALKLGLNDDERQTIRLAGLLHDIGHYPMSHDIETVYCEHAKDTYSNLQLPPAYTTIERINPSNPNADFALSGHKTKLFHHESIGALLIRSCSDLRRIIQECYVAKSSSLIRLGGRVFHATTEREKIERVTTAIIDDICSAIIGDAQHLSQVFPESYTLFVQILHSEMDADNLDYLLRDATFSGTTYGIMDMDLLIDNMRKQKVDFSLALINSKPFEYKTYSHYVLGISPKGIGCVEQFMFNRYLAYSQVIHSKYTSALGAMLRCVIMWFMNDEATKYGYKDIRGMVENVQTDHRFLHFTDNLILAKINEIDLTLPCTDLLRRIIISLRQYQSFDLFNRTASDLSFVALNPDELLKKVRACGLYTELCALQKDIDVYNNMKNGDKHSLSLSSFQYQAEYRKLTNQVPIGDFNTFLDLCKVEPEARDMHYFDRLLNGVPIIDDHCCDRPKLLVDSPTSLMSTLYNQQYVKLRKYNIS